MSIILLVLLILAGSAFAFMNQKKFGRLPKGERLKRIEQSPNYKNGHFVNLHATPLFTGESKSRLKTIWKSFFKTTPNLKPSNMEAIKTDLHKLDRNENIIIWFGHSSYFIQLDKVRYLVDPVFYTASPVSFIMKPFEGTDIYKPEDMPDIDYLIISHDHWDHLDYKTIKKMKNRISHIVCPLGVGEDFEYWGFDTKKIIEMDWQEDAKLNNTTKIYCLPARHFSGRGFTSNKTLWASFMLESKSQTIFLGGDGGYDTHFKDIGKRFPNIDLAILENGQYNKDWKYIHTMPQYLSKEAKDLNAKRVLTVHHFKFALSNHPWNEPEKNIEMMRKDSINVLDPKIGEIIKLE